MTRVLSKAMMNSSLFCLIIIINSFAFLTISVKSQVPDKPVKLGTPPKPVNTTKSELTVEDARLGEFPHQVSLHYKKNLKPFCAGSILNESFIITALHCIEDGKSLRLFAHQIFIIAGQNSLDANSGTKRDVISIHNDPRPIGKIHVNDIALLKLLEKLPKSETIAPILLNDKEVTGGLKCILIGWGMIAYPNDAEKKARIRSKTLKKTKFTTMIRTNCLTKFAKSSYREFFAKDTFCTTSHPDAAQAQKSCQVADDSGGPLICNGSLTGIVSYATSCRQEFHPAIYVDVYEHLNFIKYNRIGSKSFIDPPGFRRD